MTCCVAALCDDGKSMVLVADKMVGMGIIEGEPDIKKVFRVHKDWRAMIAGDDICPIFPVIDSMKSKLGRVGVSVDTVMQTAYQCYRAERNAIAEAVHLAPMGWTMQQFNSPQSSGILGYSRKDIAAKLSSCPLEVVLLVAGFDNRGKGHIISLDDYEKRGLPQRHDIPGYWAIGSGADGAMYMMAYREVSLSMPLRLVLYYAIEGKYFGERAAGVGTRTDAYIMRAGQNVFRIKETVLEKYLFDLCDKLKPRELRQQHLDILNNLPGRFIEQVPKIERIKQGEDWVIREQSSTKRSKRTHQADPSDPSA